MATLIGVVAGIPVALSINRHFERRGIEAANSLATVERRKKHIQMLTAIKASIAKAIVDIEWIINNEELDFLVTTFDISVLESTAFTKYEVIEDFELLSDIDWIRGRMKYYNFVFESLLNAGLIARSNNSEATIDLLKDQRNIFTEDFLKDDIRVFRDADTRIEEIVSGEA